MYERVKHFYELGLYTKAQVAVFVQKGKLTPEQYELITGDPWGEEE